MPRNHYLEPPSDLTPSPRLRDDPEHYKQPQKRNRKAPGINFF